MPDGYEVVKVDDIEAIYLGSFRRARAALGIGAFGLQVVELAPNETRYPEHDHAHDGQQEVFAVLGGSSEIELDGKRFPLDPEHLAGVQPAVKRKLYAGPDGMRVLIVGGVAGEAFEAKDFTELGAPDPWVQS